MKIPNKIQGQANNSHVSNDLRLSLLVRLVLRREVTFPITIWRLFSVTCVEPKGTTKNQFNLDHIKCLFVVGLWQPNTKRTLQMSMARTNFRCNRSI